MNAFAFHQFGVDHQNQNKGNTDLTDNTGDDKINIMAKSLPEYTILKKLFIVGNSNEGLLGTSLPLEETVYQCSNQRHEYSKDKQYHGNQQV